MVLYMHVVRVGGTELGGGCPIAGNINSIELFAVFNDWLEFALIIDCFCRPFAGPFDPPFPDKTAVFRHTVYIQSNEQE